ncbi:MAG: hypothetical protein OXE02_03645 [Chloroflexi bacterium]|nr:hypothetical protein [Chloroflexota bacterium]
MLKRLLGLTKVEEAGGRASRTEGTPVADAHGPAEPADHGRAAGRSREPDLDALYANAIKEGMDEEKAHILGFAYADGVAQGRPSAYAIVYAAAYSIARSIIRASDEWARAYAQACAYAITTRETVGFASLYGHAVADGASPDDALVFARRYAA